MHKRSYYIVNGITLYRLLAAPFLALLIINQRPDLFKWMLAISFLTDAVDGYLARRYGVSSILGSKLDSIADDLTIVVAIIGIIVFKPEFIGHETTFIILLLTLYIVQTALALVRYRRITSFHTYAAKVAAILQGIFLLLLFFLPDPVYILFYITALVTAIDLAEEIILVLILPKWEADVKGLYWVVRRKHQEVS
ncbi:MAG: CDP-alcohol phosphatidyltransferase family protein [Chitinophagaceae bacterium]